MGPLSEVKVLEFAAAGPAPFSAMLLADLGADVLMIERPGAESPLIPKQHDMLLRNRRTIMLDLKSREGLSRARAAIERADILLEGFRPGVMERLELGPQQALAINSRLVYGRVTGWGQFGPMARVAGHDLNFLAISGALEAIGRAGQVPSIPLNMLGDFASGGMLLTIGVLAALLHARNSGKGQVVDAAMIDGLALLMASLLGLRSSGRGSSKPGDNVLSGQAPWYDVYETRDGGFYAIACVEQAFFANLLRVLGLSASWLAFHDAPDRWDALRNTLNLAFKQRTRDEWIVLFENVEACATPVLTLAEAMKHPHLRARKVFTSSDVHAQASAAPRFSETPTRDGSRAPSEADTLRGWAIE